MIETTRKTITDRWELIKDAHYIYATCEKKIKDDRKDWPDFKFEKALLIGDCFGEAYRVRFRNNKTNQSIEFRCRLTCDVEHINYE